MPLWLIACPPEAYTPEDKQAFADRITDLYANLGLPRFYVSVLFHDLPKESFFIGGKQTGDFVRVWIDQIARRVPEGLARSWMERVNKTLQPFVEDRGYRWEVHIDDTPFDLWSIEGFFPPPANSDAEKRWAADNKASPYEPVG